ncbi:hypothetical protein [Nocardia sp. CA-290969]|uniref:hypothetical protein n=1 Tax=Nocardia sp. CA-290969 TaxID=3239986 RepID=UPI003D8E6D0D
MSTIDIDRAVTEAVEKALAELVVDRRPVALDLAAAMQYSGMSKTALNQLLREEKIVARKFGTKNLFLRESLDRYLSSLPAWGSR